MPKENNYSWVSEPFTKIKIKIKNEIQYNRKCFFSLLYTQTYNN